MTHEDVKLKSMELFGEEEISPEQYAYIYNELTRGDYAYYQHPHELAGHQLRSLEDDSILVAASNLKLKSVLAAISRRINEDGVKAGEAKKTKEIKTALNL